MLCKNCGYYVHDDAFVCSHCGQLLNSKASAKETGAESIRQGKRAREEILNRAARKKEESNRRKRNGASHAQTEYFGNREEYIVNTEPYFDADQDDNEKTNSIERRRKTVYTDTVMSDEEASAYISAHRGMGQRKHLVNWVKVWIILLSLAVLFVAGAGYFLLQTEPGQRILARLGQNASSTAFWSVGEELMDQGDITGAISDFEKAKKQDEANGVVDVDGLLLLGNAYEADGRTDEAAQLYEMIYTGTPSRTEAYQNHIRILLGSEKEGDKALASDLMKVAYEKTGEETFNNQRRDLIPAPPEVDLTAATYNEKKYIAITSYQGFDVYFTFDETAELPAGGTLYTQRVFLDEGTRTLRAVAVNGELVSDELRATYKIIMPSPQTPRSSLAPNTYKQKQRIWLKPGLDNVNDLDIVIYYTIDGSTPDADSPVYNGDPFWLPGGKVTLKAFAVNRYAKVSNMLEILYKIDIKPVPLSALSYDEWSKDFTLYKTPMTVFQEKYGAGKETGSITVDGITDECRKFEYPWGYAVMAKVKNEWLLAEVYYTSGNFNAPRGTKIGDTRDYIVSRFRDMGQVESPSGNRGLYSNEKGNGKIWLQDDGTSIVRYRCLTNDGKWWQLEYHADKIGTVRAIDMRYTEK